MTDPFLRFRRPALTIAATCAAATMTCANALPGAVGFALAQDQAGVDTQASQAQDPSTEEGLAAWENNQARSTDPNVNVRVDLTQLTTSEQSIDAQLSIRNDTSAPLSAISVRVLSQPPAENAAAVRSAQLANFGEYAQSSALLNIPDSIGPGESRDFALHLIPDAAGAPESTNTLVTPDLFRPGSHPVMFAVSGDAQAESQQEATQQLAGVARTTVSMTRPRATDVENTENTEGTNTPTPVTFVWPLAAETHVLGGATGEAPQRGPLYLTDEHLADELAENGRLRTLLDSYREALDGPQGSQLKQASCIAVDPELIDTVERMSHGYRVGSERPSPVDVPQQLRDSWGQIFGGDEPPFEDGRGAEDARTWIEDLKSTVNQGCSVALPYAGADLNTIADAQQDWLGVHALSQGPQIVHRILGVWPTQNVVFPDAGYLSPAAAPLLRHADTLGKDADLSEMFEKRVRHGGNLSDASADEATAGSVTDTKQRDTVTAIVASNTLNVSEPPESAAAPANGITSVPLADISGSVPQSVRDQAQVNALGYSADLGSALRATGAQPEIAAYSDPSKRYNVEQDSQTARMADATAVYNEEVAAGHAVVAVPPALWSVDKNGAQSFLDAMASSLQDRRAEAKPLSSVVQVPAGKGDLVESYTDPGALSSAEITRISEQSQTLGELTTTMGNDPTIALTREGFTRPLYDDLTRATSSYRMRERGAWAETRGKLARRLEEVQKMISSLQNSVSLVPPGNVFTRTSESSPLLVLARNGLPLPVPINLDYETKDNQPLTLTLPDDTQSIPAKGSITLSLTTKPDSTEANANGNQAASESDATTNFSLWLSSQTGHRITDPVDLRVQSVPGVSPMMAIGVAVLLAGVGIVGKVLWSKRTRRTQQGSTGHQPGRPEKLQLDDN